MKMTKMIAMNLAINQIIQTIQKKEIKIMM